METLLEPLGYAFFQKGLVVASLSGALLGLIGVYIVLRGMSYIGHGLSHSIFGGFAAMQLFAAQFYAIGAGLWGIASALAITTVTKRSRVGADAAIGVITIASFALGVALFAKFGTSGPSFENALFGSILGISNGQIVGLVAVSILTTGFVVLRYRALLFSTFDPEVAGVSGVNVGRIEAALMVVLSLAILATLTVIGVTLVAAMLVIPAVIARMLTALLRPHARLQHRDWHAVRPDWHVRQLLRRCPFGNHDRSGWRRAVHRRTRLNRRSRFASIRRTRQPL
jgi:manganese/iron transport system permease protein/iron/zinc/copper transport system permease protein